MVDGLLSRKGHLFGCIDCMDRVGFEVDRNPFSFHGKVRTVFECLAW